MAKLAYLGLGAMGGPMARHLAAAGHDVAVWNRSGEKAARWADQNGGHAHGSPAAAADGADAVFACLPSDAQVDEAVLGPGGAFAAMREGALFVDHSTTSARFARRLHAEGAERGLLVVDAPVTGNEIGAEQGTLSIMCGGTHQAIARATPLMKAYAARITHIGEAGAGQAAKMCNQVAIAGTLSGVREALALALAAGLDPARVFEAISGGSAQSWQMDNRWTMLAEDGGRIAEVIGWIRKDLSFALDEARAHRVSLPVTALADQLFGEARSAAGLGWAGLGAEGGVEP